MARNKYPQRNKMLNKKTKMMNRKNGTENKKQNNSNKSKQRACPDFIKNKKFTLIRGQGE